MLKVGLILSLRGTWKGGINYFHNLLRCYREHPDPELKVLIFTEHPEDAAKYESDAIEVHQLPTITKDSPWYLLHRVFKKIRGYDPVLLRLLEHHKIDLLSYSSIGRQRRVDTLHWEPDFQFKRLPQFFDPKVIAYRDANVANAQLWGKILLSSQAAANDFRHYYPELSSVKAHVMHFSSSEVLQVQPESRKVLASKFPVDKPYFFLPNQFWKHKNHRVVVDALLLADPSIRVICTGLMEDYRDQAHVPRLLEAVRNAGLQDRFICLGVVPYYSLVSLMHNSIAVLQPSLFEGWSSSVEEAKAMGKRVILSNIDVHLEQAPERGNYFHPDSPDELAACLNLANSEYSAEIEESFVRQRPQRKLEMARAQADAFARIMTISCGDTTVAKLPN